jgi:hypothetical protein
MVLLSSNLRVLTVAHAVEPSKLHCIVEREKRETPDIGLDLWEGLSMRQQV